jgi:hypothetical protein
VIDLPIQGPAPELDACPSQVERQTKPAEAVRGLQSLNDRAAGKRRGSGSDSDENRSRARTPPHRCVLAQFSHGGGNEDSAVVVYERPEGP